MTNIKTAPFIEKNLKKETTDKYLYTAMVSHQGKPISFAMRNDGRIFYSVLNLSSIQSNTENITALDKNYWSTLDRKKHCVQFPREITQVGYAVAPNHKIDNYDSEGKRTIQGYIHEDDKWHAQDKHGTKLANNAQDENLVDSYHSSTARLGAIAPFKVLSDGKYIYLFRQSISSGGSATNNADLYKNEMPALQAFAKTNKFGYDELMQKLQSVVDSSDEQATIERILEAQKNINITYDDFCDAVDIYRNKSTASLVHSTLLVDRFIFSGASLRNSREIRYQRSRHKTTAQSKKDTLSAVDVENKPFYEPTRELSCVNNLAEGNFSILLLPGQNEEQRWQIFSHDYVTNKLNSFNIRFDNSIIFDTSDSKEVVNSFISKHSLYDRAVDDSYLIKHVQQYIHCCNTSNITGTILRNKSAKYLVANANAKISELKKDSSTLLLNSNNNALNAAIGDYLLIGTEIVVIQDINDNASLKVERARMGSTEVTEDYSTGTEVKKFIPIDPLDEIIYTIITGVSKDDMSLVSRSAWQFEEFDQNAEIAPIKQEYTIFKGMSSCYYYLQELIGKEKAPFKTSPAVMLAMSIKGQGDGQHIGVLNFTATAEGRISRLTSDQADLPDIEFTSIGSKNIKDENQKNLAIIDIDPNGLSTSGGIIKFSYNRAEDASDSVDVNMYSDAVKATAPHLFDDSLGRVNLYFKGAKNNFFALYFDPTGKKSQQQQENTVLELPSGISKLQLKNDINQQKETGIITNSKMLSNLLTLEQYSEINKLEAEKTKLENAIDIINPALSFKLRLARDLNLNISVTDSNEQKNVCTLTMKTGNTVTETWQNLPKAYENIANILNGEGQSPIGVLDPLDSSDSDRVAYKTLSEGLSTIVGRLQKDSTTLTVAKLADMGTTEGDYIRIGNEILRITAININTLTLERAQFSTSAAEYGHGTLVSYQDKSNIKIRTNTDNHIIFQKDNAFSNSATSTPTCSTATLEALSSYLHTHRDLYIGDKALRLLDSPVTIQSDVFYKTYLMAIVENSADIIKDTDTLWQYLKDLELITELTEPTAPDASPVYLQDGGQLSSTDTTLSVSSAKQFNASIGDYLSIDDEFLRIDAITGNDLTVSRGQLSSKATEHADSARIIHNNCLINGSLIPDDLLITGTSVASLRVAKGDYIKVNEEILLVNTVNVDRNQLSVERGQLNTQTVSHANGAAVIVYQRTNHRIQKAELSAALLSANSDSLNAIITAESIENLLLVLGLNSQTARIEHLRKDLCNLLLEIAKIRIISLSVQDINPLPINRLTAGLAINCSYNYQSSFTCYPAKLAGVTAPEWHQSRSYLVDASYSPAINKALATQAFNYSLYNQRSIGQWRNWQAGLAVEFRPTSTTQGALLSTAKSNHLQALQPTENGLTVEAWLKPSVAMEKASSGTILTYKKSDQHYSLAIEEETIDSEETEDTGEIKQISQYRCVATLGNRKYKTNALYSFSDSDDNPSWKHLAFTHKKMWGYRLDSQNKIVCGSDASLSLDSEFSIELMTKIAKPGMLLRKQGEYKLWVNSNKSICFNYRGHDYQFSSEQFISDNASYIDKSAESNLENLTLNFNKFCKLTLIRSINPPNKESINSTDLFNTNGASFSDSMFQDINLDDDSKDSTNADKIIVNAAKNAKNSKSNQQNWQQYMPKGTGDIDQLTDSFDISSYTEKAKQKYYFTMVITTADGHIFTTPQQEAYAVGNTDPMQQDFTLGDDSNTDFDAIYCGARIWGRALSLSEAGSLDKMRNEASLLANWPMSEGQGKYLYDQTGDNNGVLPIEAWVESPQPKLKEQLLFFIDGAYVPHTESEFSAENQQEQFTLGGIKTQDSTTDHFLGTLEEVRIWNQPRTNEEITDNAFGRLKGEWDQLLANYTFDSPIAETKGYVQDRSMTSANLSIELGSAADHFVEVLSDAPVSTEIPQVRMATSGVITAYHGHISSQPAVVEYGDVQEDTEGTMSGILKRCYSFIDADGAWHRMTGYKVGNLVSQWFSQAQYDPQVTGYLEGPPPVPGENFTDKDYGSARFNNITFKQAENVSYNYNTSKKAGWGVSVETESKHQWMKLLIKNTYKATGTMKDLADLPAEVVTAPFGAGITISPAEIALKSTAIGIERALSVAETAALTTTGKSTWESSGNRSQTYARGIKVNTDKSLTASLAAHPSSTGNTLKNNRLGNTGYALVKSKTADIYLLRLAHNNALVSINWQPNPDIPEDVNIVPFPINPLYIKQGSLDGKFGDGADDHYPQAQSAYGQYSYFKPREAYKLKKKIEREQLELEHYYQDVFNETSTESEFQTAAAITGVANTGLAALPFANTVFNSTVGHAAVQGAYQTSDLKKQLAKVGSQSNLINNYVWTMEGGFYAESTQSTNTQQEVYASDTNLKMSGSIGVNYEILGISQSPQFKNNSSLTVTKSKTKASSESFNLNVGLRLPTKPRYQYDSRLLATRSASIKPGTVDAYRFMTFYLEPKEDNFNALFNTVIDPIWLAENSDPNAQALRQAQGNAAKAKPCWRIMHRVTYVSRIIPAFTPEAPPSLEKTMSAKGIESNYMLVKKFEPYIADLDKADDFFNAIDKVIREQLPEFIGYQKEIKRYLASYYNIDAA